MRGRKPEAQQAEGGASKVPLPPSWISKEAKTEWRRVVPWLVSRKVLSDADWGLVESYCLAVGQIRQCQRTLAKEGSFVQSNRSAPRPHPAYRVMYSAMAEARRHAAELGIGPVRRIRADDDGNGNGEGDGWDSDLLA